MYASTAAFAFRCESRRGARRAWQGLKNSNVASTAPFVALIMRQSANVRQWSKQLHAGPAVRQGGFAERSPGRGLSSQLSCATKVG
jgi:hypothetical protein